MLQISELTCFSTYSCKILPRGSPKYKPNRGRGSLLKCLASNLGRGSISYQFFFFLNCYIYYMIQWEKLILIPGCYKNHGENHFCDSHQKLRPCLREGAKSYSWVFSLPYFCSNRMITGCEFDCIMEQNAPHFRQFATQISACIAGFTM